MWSIPTPWFGRKFFQEPCLQEIVPDASKRRSTLLTTMSYPQRTFAQTSIHPGSLIGRRRETVSSTTLLYQLVVLKKTGRYDAFKLKWHSSYNDAPNIWPIPNHLFWDSDVAKWIEGACYILKQQPNEEVDAAIKELVEMIRSAQQPDGYINIHITAVEPGGRWTNLRDMHEFYAFSVLCCVEDVD
jgi:hypothetical protein